MSDGHLYRAEAKNSMEKEPVIAVSLTCRQWDMLELYLSISREYRDEVYAAYERQKKEAYSNGAARFPDAASNTQFWGELCTAIDGIRQILAEREPVHHTASSGKPGKEKKIERN